MPGLDLFLKSPQPPLFVGFFLVCGLRGMEHIKLDLWDQQEALGKFLYFTKQLLQQENLESLCVLRTCKLDVIN